MSRRSCTIGIVTGIDRQAQVPWDRRRSRLVRALADRGRRAIEIDWRTIRPGRPVCGFDAGGRLVRCDPQDLDLLHVLRLGHPSRRGAPLREKWAEVAACMASVHALGVRCINHPAAILAGTDKSYLVRLSDLGLPVVPTRIVPSAVSLEELASLCPAGTTVAKPLNGECGRLVRRVGDIDAGLLAGYRRECDHMALQPFRPEIARGERSLLLIAGRFAHAVLKVPMRDFRANGRHTGARVVPHRPSDGEVALAREVGRALGPAAQIVRVDLITTDDGPLILEAETADPGHYAAIDAVYLDRLEALYDAELRAPTPASAPSKSSIVLSVDRSAPIELARQR